MAGRSPTGPLDRARSVVLAALTAEVVLLAVTGVALYFVYRPTATQAWNEIRVGPKGVQVSHLVRLVHRLSAYLAMLTAVASGVLAAVRPAGSQRWARPFLGAGLALTAAAALRTGFLLPWDQLALWALEVGTNLTGFAPLLRSQVRFVIIGGSELSPGTTLAWLAVHAALGGPAAAALLTAAWRGHRRGIAVRSAEAGGAGPVRGDPRADAVTSSP